MRVMERVRPRLFYSLHNAGFCGVVFLRVTRPPGAVPRLPRAGRNAGAAAPSRRARGAVSEDAGAGRVRAVLHRRHVRVPRRHARRGSGNGDRSGHLRRRLADARVRRSLLARLRAAVLHGSGAGRHVARGRDPTRRGARRYGPRVGAGGGNGVVLRPHRRPGAGSPADALGARLPGEGAQAPRGASAAMPRRRSTAASRRAPR